jgi:hypothetical protein
MTQKEIETAIQDLTNRVRWLELNQHPGLPKFPETYQHSPECFQQTPSTQACPPIDFEKAATYNEQQVKECLTPFTKEND